MRKMPLGSIRHAAFAIAAMSTIAFLAACTGKAKISGVRVTMPDWDAVAARGLASKSTVTASSGVVSRVMFEATSARTGRIVKIWELSRDGGSRPAYYDIPGIPSGDKVVVRVLAVVKDGNDQIFIYDRQEGTASNGAELPISLELSQIADTSVRGAVAGHIGGALGNYTGPVNIYVHPRGDEPMLVSQAEMFHGYFNFVAFPGVQFTYRKADGNGDLGSSLLTVVGQNPFDALDVKTDSLFTSSVVPNSTAAVRLHLPSAYDSGDLSKSVPEKNVIFGFFGDAGGTFTAGYPSAGVLKSVVTSGSASISWSSIATSGSIASAVAQPITVGSYVGASGVAAGSTTMVYDPTLFSQSGDDFEGLSFNGPFKRDLFNVNVTSTPAGLSMNWVFAPGVTASDIEGVAIIGRNLGSAQSEAFSDLRTDAGYDCAKAASVANQVIAQVSFAALSYAFDQNAAAKIVSGGDFGDLYSAWTQGRAQYLLCPYKGSTYYSAAIPLVSPVITPAPTPSGLALPVASLKLEPYPVGSGTIVQNVCAPLILHAYDALGSPTEIPHVGGPYGLLTDDPNANFYLDSACSMSTTSLSNTERTAAWTLYYKTAAVVTPSPRLSVTMPSGITAWSRVSSVTTIASAAAPTSMAVYGLANSAPLEKDKCYSVTFVSLRNGVAVAPTTATTWALDSTNSSNWEFYSDPTTCTTRITPFSFQLSGGRSAWQGLVKYTGPAGSAQSLILTANVTGMPSMTNSSFTVLDATDAIANPADHVSLATLPSRTNGCTPVLLSARDSNGHAVNGSGVYISAGGSAHVFDDAACGVVSNGSFSIGAGAVVKYVSGASSDLGTIPWSITGTAMNTLALDRTWPVESTSVDPAAASFALIGRAAASAGYCEPYAVAPVNATLQLGVLSSEQPWYFSAGGFPANALFFGGANGDLAHCQNTDVAQSVETPLTTTAPVQIIWVKPFLASPIQIVPITGSSTLGASVPLSLTP